MQKDHPYIATIARYFNAANAGDPDGIMRCFAPDIDVYTMGYPPRFGGRVAAQTFVGLHASGARWTIDHCVIDEPEAVVEWTMLARPTGESHDVMHRGIDWFVFGEDGRIKQIREFLHGAHALDGFPYSERGYPMQGDVDSRLPN
jgi:ketosteroid isomerase-like protein